MAISFGNTYFLLPPSCSNQASVVVANRTIHVGNGYHRSLISCSPQRSVSSAVCVQQEHKKFSPLRHGFCSLVNLNYRFENDSRHGGSRRSSRRTQKSGGRGIASASSAVDETALEEVGCALKRSDSFIFGLCTGFMLTY